MKIDDYFASLERGLSQNPRISKIEEPIILLASDNYNGLIRCRVIFWDGSFLDIYEVVSTELGYPVRINYAYTYLRNDQRVFRYDNAPHHPEIATHPTKCTLVQKIGWLLPTSPASAKFLPKSRSC